MRKKIIFAAAAALLALVSCSKEEAIETLGRESQVKAAGVAVDVNQIKPVPFGETKLNFVADLVDLGLSVKWATCNLGAAEPGQYGDYYQWGGTADVSNPYNPDRIDYVHCPFHMDSEGDKGWLKYIPSDKSSYWSWSDAPGNRTALGLEDDAAHAKLGGNWRMPAKTEWEELLNESNCTWTWDEARKGYIVTSKKTGYEGRSIFLPAAGYRNEMGPAAFGEKGSYWFPSLNANQPNTAQCIRFEPGKKFEMGALRGSRSCLSACSRLPQQIRNCLHWKPGLLLVIVCIRWQVRVYDVCRRLCSNRQLQSARSGLCYPPCGRCIRIINS